MRKNNSSLKWIISVSGKSIIFVILLSVLGALMSYLSVRFAVVSKSVIDIATGVSEGKLSDALFALTAFIAMQILIHIIYTVSEVRVSCKLTNTIQRQTFSRLIKRDYMSVGKYHSGELVNRLSTDSLAVSGGVMSIVPVAATLLSKAYFGFCELFRLDYQLALICLIAFPIVTLAARIYGKKMKLLRKKCLESDGTIKSFLQDSVQNILAVKAFVKEELCTVRLEDMQSKNYRLKVKQGVISMLANLLFFAIMTFAYYFALMWCAAKIHSGVMTVGTLTAILQLIGIMQDPFQSFSSVISGYYTTTASAERLIELELLKEDKSEYFDISQTNFEKLKFNDVTFSYDDEKVLSSINTTLSAGEIAAVSGESGIGKSTFMKLAMGVLAPVSGSVDIICDGKKISPARSRNLFSYVPQGNMILAGTILENITFFDQNADLEKAKQSASLAMLGEYIEALPDGYNTFIGEGGIGLSEGQIQRIAIARALYADRPILLLDEATSSLDEATEKSIITNIKSLKGITGIIITHRPCAKHIADYELIFDKTGTSVSKKCQN